MCVRAYFLAHKLGHHANIYVRFVQILILKQIYTETSEPSLEALEL